MRAAKFGRLHRTAVRWMARRPGSAASVVINLKVADTPIVSWNAKFGVVKVNPLANWTEKQTWDYILANKIPYNPLLDQGYSSIGCYNCTLPGVQGRAGRWQGFEKDECGLHT